MRQAIITDKIFKINLTTIKTDTGKLFKTGHLVINIS